MPPSSEPKSYPLLTRFMGERDPLSISAYQGKGGFAALSKAFSLKPREIVGEISDAKLLGRGGAAYPAGKKWRQLLSIDGFPKYIVCNADEGEPGTFKDRLIMEEAPYLLVEGMAIAGLAFGSSQGYIYVRGEYRKIQKSLLKAIENAKDAGFLGSGIPGSSFSFGIKVVSGAGAYVCGENSALLDSTEGKAGRPRIKPPHLAEAGLFLKPTLVNNVETFANVPLIISMGAKEFLSLGHPEGGGTKLACLSGHVERPGVYEVRLGKATLRDLIFDPELGGGIKGGKAFKFAHLGGQSGAIAPPSSLDVPYSHSDLRKAGLSVGSGAVAVYDESVSVLDYLRCVAEFFIHESCGKCVPCREGNKMLLRYLNALSEEGALSKESLSHIKELASAMSRASFCGLGQTSPTALKSAWKAFKEEFEANVQGGAKRRAAGA